jgi:hypothetical protein
MEAAMTPRKDNFPKPHPRRRRARLEVKNPDAAGIDVGATAHWVYVPADRQQHPVALWDLHGRSRGLALPKHGNGRILNS